MVSKKAELIRVIKKTDGVLVRILRFGYKYDCKNDNEVKKLLRKIRRLGLR